MCIYMDDSIIHGTRINTGSAIIIIASYADRLAPGVLLVLTATANKLTCSFCCDRCLSIANSLSHT